jgi:phage-related protein
MPRTDVVLFQEPDGTVPLLEWLDGLPTKAVSKCRVRIERLRELGHELRRPEADFLRDGIYELRVSMQSVNDRMLYFFHWQEAVVLPQGLVKERRDSPKEIGLAIARKKRFENAPDKHTYRE